MWCGKLVWAILILSGILCHLEMTGGWEGVHMQSPCHCIHQTWASPGFDTHGLFCTSPPPRPSRTTMCCFRKDGRRNRSLLRTLQWPSTAFRIRTIVLKSYVQDSMHTISLQSYQAPHCPSHGSYLLVLWGWALLDCSPCLQGTSSRMKVCICSGHHDSCSGDVNIW